MIWAQARDGAIGRGGDMPWHLPEDLAHFKGVTLGDPVIMGRRTWESLPERFRPLPGRENLVVTRSAEFNAPGAIVVASLEAAIERALGGGGTAGTAGTAGGGDPQRVRAWIMGGGELYRAAMPYATELVVTQIDTEVPDADTYAPTIGPEWRVADPGVAQLAASGLNYRFVRYLRDAP